ncbi:MAG: abortive infection family protein [Candidatus Aenigmarchaeota archaeon]|nr:abortive infection family protein [Candidatus Aenigmarchaeota archaeon]
MLGPIKDLYLRRMKNLKGELPDYYSYKLNQTIRHKIIGRILDSNYEKSRMYDSYDYNELKELIISIERELGRTLYAELASINKFTNFMFRCSDEEFLSSLELLLSIKIKNLSQFQEDYDQIKNTTEILIVNINKIFKIDKIGYEIIPAGLEDLPFIIVPFNSKYLYLETIKKPMSLMHSEKFKGALNEFEKAIEKYRKDDFENAIGEANKAYESTLKTVLFFKKIPFDETRDKIPRLVDKVKSANIIDSTLESVFNSFWPVLKNGPNNIRNLSGVAHGQGVDVKTIQKSYADFVLRTVGTYIVFLIEKFQESR